MNDLGTYFTDENGQIKLTKLRDGWYRVTEVEPAAGYAIKDPATQDCFIQAGTGKVLTFENTPLSALIIKKVDADSGTMLQGAKFRVRYLGGTSGTGGTVIGEYTTSANGTIVITGLKAGTYIVEETKAPTGYEIDDTPQTVYLSGKEQDVVTVEFSNGKHGDLIIDKIDSVTKQPLPGAQFKITTSDGSFVGNYGGTVASNGIYTTDSNGQIKLVDLKPDTYVVTEIKAPDGYVLDSTSQTVKVDRNDTQTLTFINDKELTAYLEYEGQILRFEVEDKSLSTGVAITKTGPKEIVAGQPVRYAFSGIANTSNVSLSNFYWRDTLPAQVRLDTVVTGTYNRPGTYKIVYRVNGGGHRTLADNLSTQKNYTLAASATALKLASNERVTEIMFVFGQAPAGFAQVEKPYLHCKAVTGLSAGSFVNVADVGGTYGGTWVQGISRWVTTVYGKPVIPTLPKTGY